MPLLHRTNFIKKKPNPNLKPTDKVFFCDLTEEVFTDYDEFWSRLVLLNALVWSCELTGKPNLTYQEALESENRARKSISNVSVALKRPLLYISTFTRRGRMADASDDIFNYVRDRYFVGETVEAIVSNHWYDCKVTKVIMPTKQEVLAYEQSLEESEDEEEDDDVLITETKLCNGNNDDDIIVIRDDHLKTPDASKEKQAIKSKQKEETSEYPPFPTVKYEVIEIEPWDYKEPKHHIVTWDQIRRSKSAFTREKCKLFVKQCMHLNSEGYWSLKESIDKQLNVRQMKYTDIFVGRPPKFEETKLKKIPTQMHLVPKKKKDDKKKDDRKKEEKKEDRKKEEKKKDDAKKKDMEPKKKGRPFMSEEEREAARKIQMELKEKVKVDYRKKLELEKLERKQKKDLLKEEERLMKHYKQFWWQKKEDLECEDHKDLPPATRLETRIPMNYFGDFLMVLDFINTFSEIIELGDVYPSGITYQMLEHALVEKEVAGVFNDVVQLLLGAIFSLQEEEDEEVEGDTALDIASMNLEEHLESKSQMAAVNIANKASTWSQQYQGVSLQKAPLDALTLTEILRLHILASGATNVANAFWRHMNRGGYKHTDDPGLQFKLDEPEIIKKLSTESLFDLSVEHKLKIFNVLVCQILTFTSVRDNIEEKIDKLREFTNHYKTYKWAAQRKEREEQKKEKEEQVARKQKMKDIKAKLDQKLQEQRLQTTMEASENGTKAEIVAMEELEEFEEEREKETRASTKKKDESTKQEKDFIDQIESLSRDVKQLQLGQDRAFRRYWIFNTIPGLFVEDLSTNLGSCLEGPTPVRPVLYPDDDSELKEAIKQQALRNLEIMNKEREIEKNSSDKENENGETPIKHELKAPLLEKQLLKTPNNNVVQPADATKETCDDAAKAAAMSPKDYSPKVPEEEEEEIVDLITLPEKPVDDSANIEELHSKIFGLCSANALTCPAHSYAHSRPRWAYFSRTEELDDLISSLNARGLRESELKNNLLLNKEKIRSSMLSALTYVYDYSGKDETTSDMKKTLKRNLNFAPGTPIDRILDLTLRDMILETEEKIDNGMLGLLKVPQREAWRQAIVDGTSLSLTNTQDLDCGGKKRITQLKASLGIESREDEFGDSEDLIPKDGFSQAGVVKELAIAILKIAQALDPKYLKAPLAELEKLSRKRKQMEEKVRKKCKKGGNEDSSSDEEEQQELKNTFEPPKNIDNALRTPFERWEKSLMACTSLSQLFLHLATFDNSVTWSRSAVLYKRCRVCRRGSDPDNIMLLCDACDGGYHMYCLKPKLKSVPDGDWFCPRCKPKAKPKSPKKARHVYNEDQEEEEGEEEEEEEEDAEKEELEDEEEEEEQDEEQEELEFINHEYCDACGIGGEIVCCDTCPRSFHQDCADLKKVPRGLWSCPLCKEKKSNLQKKTKLGKARSGKNKKLKSDEDIENILRRSSKRMMAEDDSSDVLRLKRGTKRTIEETEDEEYHQDSIEKMIDALMSHNDSKPFRKPVYKQAVPDYYVKIKKPIDLRTIKTRFNKRKYTSDAEFIADVLLIFQNTQQFYKKSDPEYAAGRKVSKFFLNKVRNSNLHSAGLIDGGDEQPSKKRKKY